VLEQGTTPEDDQSCGTKLEQKQKHEKANKALEKLDLQHIDVVI